MVFLDDYEVALKYVHVPPIVCRSRSGIRFDMPRLILGPTLKFVCGIRVVVDIYVPNGTDAGTCSHPTQRTRATMLRHRSGYMQTVNHLSSSR